ncbi:hypothetical protein [Photobacterium sp. Hal280]|uniref:hypothetical protein n=1 Tax=Photobacterium sp. Hal280 TaxID=3035163 RepID=UPI00301C5D2E
MNQKQEQALYWLQCRAAENTAIPEENDGVLEYLEQLVKRDIKKATTEIGEPGGGQALRTG